jgi:phospholipid transport system transporter-binding protein
MDSAAGVLAASTELALPGAGGIDLERVDAVDSAGVAVLLAWQRRALAEGKTLTFTGVPKSLTSLAELYDVEGLITA